jgi:hypothetical protein
MVVGRNVGKRGMCVMKDSLVAHTVEGIGIDEPKVTSVDYSSRFILSDKSVELVVCAREMSRVVEYG